MAESKKAAEAAPAKAKETTFRVAAVHEFTCNDLRDRPYTQRLMPGNTYKVVPDTDPALAGLQFQPFHNLVSASLWTAERGNIQLEK